MNQLTLEPGNSRDYSRLTHRFDQILAYVHERWPVLNAQRHEAQQYEEQDTEVWVEVKADGSVNKEIEAIIEVAPREEDNDTLLIISWGARLKRAAKPLATAASRSGTLALPGVRPPDPDRYEWYVRGLSLSEIERMPEKERSNAVLGFLRETIQAIEASGILDKVAF